MVVNTIVYFDNIVGVSNGDFETGDLTDWYVYYACNEGYAIATSYAASSGSYGAYIELVDTNPGDPPYIPPEYILLYTDTVPDLSAITSLDFKINYLDAASNQGVEVIILGTTYPPYTSYLIMDATYDSTTDWITIDSGSFVDTLPAASGELDIIVAAYGEYIPPPPAHATLYIDNISFSGIQPIDSSISSSSQITASTIDTTPLTFYIKEVLCMGSPQECTSTTDLGHEIMERALNDTPVFTDIGHSAIDLYHTDVGHSIALKTYPDFTTYGIKIIKQIINFLHARMRRST